MVIKMFFLVLLATARHAEGLMGLKVQLMEKQ